MELDYKPPYHSIVIERGHLHMTGGWIFDENGPCVAIVPVDKNNEQCTTLMTQTKTS